MSESDILAELNANLAKIAEKDKHKPKKPVKKAMFTVAIEDPEENKVETEIELRIDPSKLLKVSKKASYVYVKKLPKYAKTEDGNLKNTKSEVHYILQSDNEKSRTVKPAAGQRNLKGSTLKPSFRPAKFKQLQHVKGRCQILILRHL